MIGFFEASYIAYLEKLNEDEFWSMVLSNNINLEELDYVDTIFYNSFKK